MTVKARLIERAKPVEAFLASCLRGRDIPERLLGSMEYSLLAGGKRLRPVLALSWCALLGGDAKAHGQAEHLFRPKEVMKALER